MQGLAPAGSLSSLGSVGALSALRSLRFLRYLRTLRSLRSLSAPRSLRLLGAQGLALQVGHDAIEALGHLTELAFQAGQAALRELEGLDQTRDLLGPRAPWLRGRQGARSRWWRPLS